MIYKDDSESTVLYDTLLSLKEIRDELKDTLIGVEAQIKALEQFGRMPAPGFISQVEALGFVMPENGGSA